MAFEIKEKFDEFKEEHGRKISIGSILFVTMISSIAVFTYVDITVHDFYALPWGEMCYTGNTNPDCIHIEQIHNCPNGGDACIEAMYAGMLQVEAFYLSFILVFLKIAVSQGLLRLEFNWVRGFQTFVWGASPLILLWSGWEDFLYYTARLQPIPNPMSWLNNAGFFPYVMQWITHDVNAGPLDLFIVMMGGLITVSVLFYLYYRFTDEEDYKIPI